MVLLVVNRDTYVLIFWNLYISSCNHHYTEPVPPPTTVDPYGYCPTGWEAYNGNCYRFDADKRAQYWDAAQYECQTDFGSHLASINDGDENAFITQHVLETFGQANIWIGLRREGGEYIKWRNREQMWPAPPKSGTSRMRLFWDIRYLNFKGGNWSDGQIWGFSVFAILQS